MHQKELISPIGRVDPMDYYLITFDIDQSRPRIPLQNDFKIQVISHGINIFHTIFDE
jgi:hypothetical protein